MRRGRTSRTGLVALGLGAFVVGTAELLVVGVLDLVARDLDVSVSSAGGLVSAYALGISLGGPLLAAATIRVGRRELLGLSLGAYVVGNVLALTAASFGVLLLARLLTGALHGLFIGVAFAVAAALVPASRRGQAVSVVMGGITVAMVVGVPLGTLIGEAISWRAAFLAVVLLGAVALAAAILLVPPLRPGGAPRLGAQARAALSPPVLAMLALALLLMGGQFTAFTYLAPYLHEVTGVSTAAVSAFLLIYGIAAAAGTWVGGRAADGNAPMALVLANLLLIAALGLLYATGSAPVPAALLLTMWAIVGLGLVPALQLRIMSLAGEGSDLAATLGASAVNAGIAVGSLVGGAVVAGPGVDTVPLAALALCAVALPVTWATRHLSSSTTPAVTPAAVPDAAA